jgi:hypothetical protein
MPRTPRRPSAALVISSLALFAAVGGTGYAATTVAGSHATARKGHKKTTKALTSAQVNQLIASYFASHAASLHGAAGANGSPGPQGLPGGAGPAGPPGPTTTTAPSGSTQTGVLAVEAYEPASGNNTDTKTSISFPLQLTSAPTVDQVPFSSTDSHCSGNTGSPTAARGYLCIYIRGTTNSAAFSPNQPLYPQEPANLNYGAGTSGVILTARANAAGTVEVLGSWAVTAP